MLINPRPPLARVTETYDSDYSAHYIDKAAKKRNRCARWVTRVQKRYAANGRWLDVGCSAGFVVEAATAAGFEAHGVEVEAAAVDYATRELGLKNVSCGTLEEQAYPAAHFDVVSLYDVIEHVPDLTCRGRRTRAYTQARWGN